MLEIFKPATHGAINIRNNRLHALPIIAPRLCPYRVFELAKALLSGPLHVSFKVISKKIESTLLCRIHNPRLDWMQL